jgi:hypothetical protein
VKLEVGKTYRARNGTLWKVTDQNKHRVYCFEARPADENVRGLRCYTPEGREWESSLSDYDLLEEGSTEQRTTGLNLVEVYRAVKTGEWEFRRPWWHSWWGFRELLNKQHTLSLEAEDYELRPKQKPLELQAGHYYETREGGLAFVASVAAPGPTPQCVGWLQRNDYWSVRSWSKTGEYCLNSDKESSCDLVRDLGTEKPD